MADRKELVAFAQSILSETKEDHAQVVASAMEAIGLKEATNPQELLDFLASRVKWWADKAECSVNAADFRNSKSEAQVALLLYRLALGSQKKTD